MTKNITETGVPHKRSKQLQDFKKKANLPEWKELNDQLDEGMSAIVEKKVELMQRFAVAQRLLYETCSANGWKVANVINNITDLQGKLWELEEDLRRQGKNPLESAEWMKARELLMKEAQFMHKHKLDLDRFNEGVGHQRRKFDDDAVFEVKQ